MSKWKRNIGNFLCGNFLIAAMIIFFIQNFFFKAHIVKIAYSDFKALLQARKIMMSCLARV